MNKPTPFEQNILDSRLEMIDGKGYLITKTDWKLPLTDKQYAKALRDKAAYLEQQIKEANERNQQQYRQVFENLSF